MRALMGWGLLFVWMLTCSGVAKPGANFDAAFKQREKLRQELSLQVKELPSLTQRVEALERELQALEKSTGKVAPQQSVNLSNPEFTNVDPVNYQDFTPQQQAQLQSIDAEITQCKAMIPAVQRGRTRLAKLEAQIAILKRR